MPGKNCFTAFLAVAAGAVVATAGHAQIQSVVVAESGTATVYIEPLENLPNDGDPLGWTEPGYDTSQDDGKGDPDTGLNWQAGVLGVGYGDLDDDTPILNDGNTLSVYTRTEFSVDSAFQVQAMRWEVDYDDGYVAYLNGVEFIRSDNMTAAPPEWDSVTTGGHGSSEAGILEPPVDVSDAISLLVDGTNVLAVSTHNTDPGSSDMTMLLRLTLDIDPNAGPIARQPQGGLAEEGESHTFVFELNDPVEPVSYAWTKNGNPVGPNSGTYTIDPLTIADSGTYVCTATDASKGVFVSNPAILNVVAAGSLPASNWLGLFAALLTVAALSGLALRKRRA